MTYNVLGHLDIASVHFRRTTVTLQLRNLGTNTGSLNLGELPTPSEARRLVFISKDFLDWAEKTHLEKLVDLLQRPSAQFRQEEDGIQESDEGYGAKDESDVPADVVHDIRGAVGRQERPQNILRGANSQQLLSHPHSTHFRRDDERVRRECDLCGKDKQDEAGHNDGLLLMVGRQVRCASQTANEAAPKGEEERANDAKRAAADSVGCQDGEDSAKSAHHVNNNTVDKGVGAETGVEEECWSISVVELVSACFVHGKHETRVLYVSRVSAKPDSPVHVSSTVQKVLPARCRR